MTSSKSSGAKSSGAKPSGAKPSGPERLWAKVRSVWDASPWVLSYLAFWTVYFILFWTRALRFDKAGDLIAGNINIWGDWAVHFTFGSTMAYRQLIPKSSPLLIGDTFSYPFVADMISALLHRAGMDFFLAFTLPSCLFSILLAGALLYFLRTLFKSDAVAVLGSSIFMFGGGLGFVYFIRDIFTSSAPLATFFNPAHEYTRVAGTPIVLLSVIDSAIIPQRSFTLGIPLALIALSLIYSTVRSDSPQRSPRARWIRIVGAALILGVLPLVHTHSFLAVFIVLCFWAVGDIAFQRKGTVLERLRPWAVVAVITTVVAWPLLTSFILKRVSSEGFIRWFPGWYAKDLSVNWLWFWLSNWSITPILALVGLWMLYRRGESRDDRLGRLFVYLPFVAIFVLLNLFLFQPWVWDNTKLLAWASIGFSGLSAYAVVTLWTNRPIWLQFRRAEADEHGNRQLDMSRYIAVLLVVVMIASGVIDAYRVERVDLHENMLYSAEDFQIAKWVRRNTAVDSIWLTGDRHNHWVSNLTGRQTVMGFRGWLWGQGYDYHAVESDVSKMFTVKSDTLLKKYGVDYIVVGADETQTWHADAGAMRRRFPVVKQTQSYTIFKVQ